MSRNKGASLFYRKERNTWIVQYYINDYDDKRTKKSFKEKADAESFLEELMYKKDNKKLMKKVEDNISWVMQIFEYPPMIRKLIYTTNAIESLNAGLRKVTKGKGSFINETALMKVLYLRIQNLKKKWSKQIQSWKQVQNELYGIFEERFIQYIEK